jgi:hypothetical protein
MAKCRLCGKELRELEGSYLERINGKGGTGIWECRPRCGSGLPQDLVLLSALNVGTEIEHDYTFLENQAQP